MNYENAFHVELEVEGCEGFTYTCTDSMYYNGVWLYEMTNDHDEYDTIIIDENGEKQGEGTLNYYLAY